MISGIDNNRFDRSWKSRRKVNRINHAQDHEYSEKETIVIDVEYEELGSTEIEETTLSVKDELVLYNRKGKLRTFNRKKHNLEKTA